MDYFIKHLVGIPQQNGRVEWNIANLWNVAHVLMCQPKLNVQVYASTMCKLLEIYVISDSVRN